MDTYIIPKVNVKNTIKELNKDEIKDNIKETRFSKGYEYPKCQCKDVNKNGKSNGRQR